MTKATDAASWRSLGTASVWVTLYCLVSGDLAGLSDALLGILKIALDDSVLGQQPQQF